MEGARRGYSDIRAGHGEWTVGTSGLNEEIEELDVDGVAGVRNVLEKQRPIRRYFSALGRSHQKLCVAFQPMSSFFISWLSTS